MNNVEKNLLKVVADMTEKPTGAYNIRADGKGVERFSTANIQIISKEDQPGIIIKVAPGTKGESVHIPVIMTQSGEYDKVYNDFEIGEGAQVEIVAGCGIHNCGCDTSQHDGIHTFYIGKGAKVTYVEKHYGEGEGSGARVLNPTTIVNMEEASYCEMEMVQIKGVDSTLRETKAYLQKGAKLVITEKLMTHDKQVAESNMSVYLEGEDAVTQIVSRSVAKNASKQVFHPSAIGNNKCKAHIQCDAIIMDEAKVRSIPEIEANHQDAQIIHEAAIGRINNEQLIKLQTLGLTEEEAEAVIIDTFLS